MKKILLALLLVVCMAVPAIAEVQLGKDFKLDGYVAMGYVLASDYSTTVTGIDNWFTDKDESGSDWAFQTEIGITWKDTLRPYLFWSGLSGTGANGEWAFNNYIFSVGAEFYLYKTDYGKLGIYGCYNINSVTSNDNQIYMLDVDMSAEERSWIGGVIWRF